MKTKNGMSRLSIAVQPPKRFSSQGPRLAEATFYLLSGLLLLSWALTLVSTLAPKIAAHSSVQAVLFKNSGSSTLILALAILSAVAFFGSISALRARSLPPLSASVLLVTVAALRTLQILTEGNVTLVDANVLGGLFLAAALLYYGQTKLWWFLLMPLAIVASFSPLVYFEYYRGSSVAVLAKALWMPLTAFALGSILIALRELRARAIANVTLVAVLRLRGENTLTALRAMETDLKNLRSILSGESTDVSPLKTTDFHLAPTASASAAAEPSEVCSVDEIDAAARRLLDEARSAVEGRPVKLSLTAPVGVGLPIAVRGSVLTITTWMKSAILTSIESLGGFPDGAVRVSIRPSLSMLQILVEDNGRGFGESILAKMGQSPDRVSLSEVRAAVEKLGGRFEIQARLGVGSRLSIELPRVDAFANSPRAPRLASIAAPSADQVLH